MNRKEIVERGTTLGMKMLVCMEDDPQPRVALMAISQLLGTLAWSFERDHGVTSEAVFDTAMSDAKAALLDRRSTAKKLSH